MKNRPLTFKEIFRPSGIFHWWGLIIIFLSILLGGGIGAIIGGPVGYYLIYMGKYKRYSNAKKYLIAISLTLIGLIIFLVMVALLFASYGN